MARPALDALNRPAVPDNPDPSPRPALSGRAAAVGLLLLLLLLLLAGEGAVRLAAALSPTIHWGMRSWDPLAAHIEPHGEVGYRQRPGETFEYLNGTVATANAMGFRGPVVAVPKPAGTYRVIILGGSTSHGWGVPDGQAIDDYMRAELARRHPGRRFEVVNLAFDGYDSWQDFERLRSDGMRLEPDAVIINSGINDVRNARYPGLVDKDPRSILWYDVIRRQQEDARRGGPSLWSRTKHWSYLARLPGWLRSRTAAKREQVEAVQPVTPQPEAAEYFQRNLARVAALTEPRGTLLLFSTPPSALDENYRPSATSTRTYWVGDARTTQAYREELDRRMRAVADSLAAAGRRAVYVPHAMPKDVFLDDCHLTADGNARMATDFVNALERFLP